MDINSQLSDPSPLLRELETSVERFCGWLRTCQGVSYDPYDVLGTRYGRWSRRLYYERHLLGVLATAPLVAMEILYPQLRGFFVKKDHYPTADAQLALAFLNLHEMQSGKLNPELRASGNMEPVSLLDIAKQFASKLLEQSIPGYSGYCWGYPFDWQSVNGLIPRNTPHITATPYCYELFTRLFDCTGDEYYRSIAKSIVAFVREDLLDTPTGQGAAASSYTPHDRTKVVNASAYRAFLLFDAYVRFSDEHSLLKAEHNLRFVLDNQRADGSWLYAIDSPAESFVDNFHTCFVLKNLAKVNSHLHSDEVTEAVRRGYAFYRKELFDSNDNPRCYTIAPRLQIVELELYNFAEAITLGTLIHSDIPEALTFAVNIAVRLVREFQLPEGYWITRVYKGGRKHCVPFLRWPQSQLFYSISNIIVALSQRPDPKDFATADVTAASSPSLVVSQDPLLQRTLKHSDLTFLNACNDVGEL